MKGEPPWSIVWGTAPAVAGTPFPLLSGVWESQPEEYYEAIFLVAVVFLGFFSELISRGWLQLITGIPVRTV